MNPGSLILSIVMMLNHMGWNEAAYLLMGCMEKLTHCVSGEAPYV